MTVIAWDGKTLASDSMTCTGNLRSSAQKLHRAGDKIVGISGSLSDALEFIDWLVTHEGRPGAFPQSLRHDSCPINALVISADGSAFRYENTPFPIPALGKHIAIGSGRDFAMAAMHLGFDAIDAVLTASALGVSCGGDIQTLTLES